MREVAPVEVSLWTTQTALMWCAESSRRRVSIAPASAPARQSEAMNSGRSESFKAMFFHSVAKWPVSNIRTLSPGDSVLTSAASHAPVPDAGNTKTLLFVLKIPLRPSSTRRARA